VSYNADHLIIPWDKGKPESLSPVIRSLGNNRGPTYSNFILKVCCYYGQNQQFVFRDATADLVSTTETWTWALPSNSNQMFDGRKSRKNLLTSVDNQSSPQYFSSVPQFPGQFFSSLRSLLSLRRVPNLAALGSMNGVALRNHCLATTSYRHWWDFAALPLEQVGVIWYPVTGLLISCHSLN